MEEEIKAAIRKMKLCKVTCPNSISVEFLEALEDNGFDKITTLLTQTKSMTAVRFLKTFSKSIFIALPKKPEALECKLNRTISLKVQKEIYLHFTDYSRAFVRIWHDEIITQQKQLMIDGKDLPLIKKYLLGTDSSNCKSMKRSTHLI